MSKILINACWTHKISEILRKLIYVFKEMISYLVEFSHNILFLIKFYFKIK